jgi:DNA-binding transcriptional MocR family regulator
MEFSVQSCLESLDISLLSEWDVLAFVYRRGASLTSADQIASLIGYEGTVVSAALERLERDGLIEHSQAFQGVGLYRIGAPTDAVRHDRVLQLISLSKTRPGRIILLGQLKPVCRNRGEKRLRLEKEGKWLCLKAI